MIGTEVATVYFGVPRFSQRLLDRGTGLSHSRKLWNLILPLESLWLIRWREPHSREPALISSLISSLYTPCRSQLGGTHGSGSDAAPCHPTERLAMRRSRGTSGRRQRRRVPTVWHAGCGQERAATRAASGRTALRRRRQTMWRSSGSVAARPRAVSWRAAKRRGCSRCRCRQAGPTSPRRESCHQPLCSFRCGFCLLE